jgi:hypothetical protein
MKAGSGPASTNRMTREPRQLVRGKAFNALVQEFYAWGPATPTDASTQSAAPV